MAEDLVAQAHHLCTLAQRSLDNRRYAAAANTAIRIVTGVQQLFKGWSVVIVFVGN